MTFFLQKRIKGVAFAGKATANRGMTFLELIVVLGIFGAISATVLFNYHDFSTNVSLQNLAQDIALQLKRAQTDAVSGRMPTFPAGSNQELNNSALIPPDWKPSYGVAFDINTPADWTLGNTGFVYYFNQGLVTPGNPPNRDFDDFALGSYQGCGALAPDSSECLEEIQINSGSVIDMICFDFISIDDACTTGTESPNGQGFVAFTRPRGNAVILGGASDDGVTPPHSNMYIRITSPSGSHKYISVWESGYISVQ
jgi:prepilin-type N-terminal cleavage/methylation domain-containing protein